VHTSAKACLTSVAIWIHLYPWPRSSPKCNHLFISPLPTFPENFMQIYFWSFCADRQTNDYYITSSAEVIINIITSLANKCRSVSLSCPNLAKRAPHYELHWDRSFIVFTSTVLGGRLVVTCLTMVREMTGANLILDCIAFLHCLGWFSFSPSVRQ